VIDEELVSPRAFDLSVVARASYLARSTGAEGRLLRPFAQLTLLMGIQLEDASREIQARGLAGAYRWAVTLQPDIRLEGA
jgi:hypothetical protein